MHGPSRPCLGEPLGACSWLHACGGPGACACRAPAETLGRPLPPSSGPAAAASAWVRSGPAEPCCADAGAGSARLRDLFAPRVLARAAGAFVTETPGAPSPAFAGVTTSPAASVEGARSASDDLVVLHAAAQGRAGAVGSGWLWYRSAASRGHGRFQSLHRWSARNACPFPCMQCRGGARVCTHQLGYNSHGSRTLSSARLAGTTPRARFCQTRTVDQPHGCTMVPMRTWNADELGLILTFAGASRPPSPHPLASSVLNCTSETFKGAVLPVDHPRRPAPQVQSAFGA